MTIININHANEKATLNFDINELTTICNAMYYYITEHRDKHFELKKELDIARDICDYGHVDNFTLTKNLERLEREEQCADFEMRDSENE